MENYNHLSESNTEQNLSFTTAIKEELLQSAKWAKIIAIVGFIMVGFMVLISLFMFASALMNSSSDFGFYGGFGLSILSFIYFPMALMYYFPIKYLFDYATKVNKALVSLNEFDVLDAFKSLTKHYKLVCIYIFIFIALYGLLFLVVLIGGAAGLMNL